VCNLCHQVGLSQLVRRKVDIHPHIEVARSATAPFAHLTTDFAQHPVTDRIDQPDLFRKRDKLIGRDQAVLRMLPARQRFEGDHPPTIKGDDRLIVDTQLIALDSAP
jgi:hypothetical protein